MSKRQKSKTKEKNQPKTETKDKKSQSKKEDQGNFKTFLSDNWPLLLILVYVISPFDFLPEAVFGPLGVIEDAGLIFAEIIRRFIIARRGE